MPRYATAGGPFEFELKLRGLSDASRYAVTLYNESYTPTGTATMTGAALSAWTVTLAERSSLLVEFSSAST